MTAITHSPSVPIAGTEPAVAVRRRTIDTVLTASGAVFAVVLLAAGVLLTWGSNFSEDYVYDELSSQNIVFPPAAALAQNAYVQLGIDKPVYQSHGIGNQVFLDEAGDSAEGLLAPLGKMLVADQLPEDDPQKEVVNTFVGDFEEKYGKQPSTFAGHAYDGFWIAVNAIEEAEAYHQLIARHGHTQEGLARIVHKSRSHVANLLRLLDLPDVALLDAAITEPVARRQGRLVVARDLDSATADALEVVRADLEADPFRAPDADRLATLGLDRLTLARLARDGHVLLLGDSVVLLPGADDEAVELLGRLDQPFTTSRARQALGTSRRVVLSLLSHLDQTGRTVRLPDDTRRVR